MSKVISRLALVALALIVMGSLMVKADDDGWTLKWDGGFKLTDADGDFELKWGGRMMNDWLWIASFDDDLAAVISETPAGMEWRRARLFVSGKAYGNIEFKAQYDFAGGDVDFKDLYMGITGTPVGTFRFGHFKAPFSLEELTSSKYITFMERSLPNVFAIGRDTGFAILGHNGDKTITWGFGLFVDSDDYAVNTDHDHDAWEVVGRVTFLPMHENNDLLHVGAGFYFRDLEDNAVRFRSRPEVHLGSRFVDTHSFEADSVTGLGLELAYVGGPLSFQSEFMYTMVGSTEYNDPNFMGYYAYVSYFLTDGDHRAYKTSDGAFDKVKPKAPFSPDGGIGAWELAARFSYLDLNDGMVVGGELMDFTVGMNWYLNNAMRWMFNYIYADLDGAGTAHMFQSRFQIFF